MKWLVLLCRDKSNSMVYNSKGMRIKYTTSDNVSTKYLLRRLVVLWSFKQNNNTITKKYYNSIYMEIPESSRNLQTSVFLPLRRLGDVVQSEQMKRKCCSGYQFDAFGKSTNVKQDTVNKSSLLGRRLMKIGHYFLARYYARRLGDF